MMKPTRIFLLMFLWSAAVTGLRAQVTAVKAGQDINSLLTVPVTIQDQHLVSGIPAGSVYLNNHPAVQVRLEHRDYRNNFFPKNWQAQVTYKLELWTTNTVSPDLTKPAEILTVNFDKALPYTDFAVLKYPDYKKARLQVMSIIFTTFDDSGTPTVTSAIPANTGALDWTDLVLTLEYLPDYVYSKTTVNAQLGLAHAPAAGSPQQPQQFNYCPVAGSGWYTAADNSVSIDWTPRAQAVSYDLEWVFIDIPTAPFNAVYEFDWRNAVRVNTVSPQYRIPLAYGRGKIVYRVRTVSREWDSGSGTFYRSEGPWSRTGTYASGRPHLDRTETDGSMTNKNYFNYCGLEPGKNWSYNASYAEDGKAGETLAFADATGRTRQTVAFNPADNKAVVSETYYDRQGRAAIQVLPTPVANKGNAFYGDFNAGFSAAGFDTEPIWAAGSNAGLPAAHKTNLYYSSSTPFLSEAAYNVLIPTADNYPFVQTRYGNDGMGRTESVSAAGAKHKLGGGFDTKQLYGSLGGQQELDRLFGNEAGFAEHYRKQMATDPNGVTSVSYTDGSGRVIATALAGDAAKGNLTSVAHTPSSVTVDLMDNVTSGTDGSVNTLKELLVPVPGIYRFDYRLDGTSFSFPCRDPQGCLYDVRFNVYDAEGNPVPMTRNGSPFNGEFAGIASQAAMQFSVSFAYAGNYTVVKHTSPSAQMDAFPEAFEQYVADMGIGPGNTCLPTDLAPTLCPTCAEKCESAYKYTLTYGGYTGDIYIARDGTLYTSVNRLAQALQTGFPDDRFVLDADGTHIAAVQARIDSCKLHCLDTIPTLEMDQCDIFRQVLSADVSPGGQYFDNRTFAALENQSAPNNQWLTMFVPAHVRDSLFTAAGTGSWDGLRAAWRDGMAAALLPFHPEYCQYNYFCRVAGGRASACCKPSMPELNRYATSADFDAAAHTVHTDAGALALGLFDPLTLNYSNGLYPPGVVPPNYENIDCETKDPYFCQNDPAYVQMADYLTKYIENPWLPGAYFSIWNVLRDDGSSHTAATPQETAVKNFLQDLHGRFDSGEITRYQFFRGYYQGRKKQIIQNAFPAWAAGHCNTCTNFVAAACSTCTAGNPAPETCRACWLSILDGDNDGQIDDNGHTAAACAPATGSFPLTGFSIRYPYIAALNGPDATPADLCTANCRGYAQSWVNQLTDVWLGCEFATPLSPADREALQADFYAFCMGVCDNPLSPAAPGAVPDFNIYTDQLNGIASDFLTPRGGTYCPRLDLFTYATQADGNTPPPAPPAQGGGPKLPCQCGNLAEMILASGAMTAPATYPNPLHYERYGAAVGDVYDGIAAAAYMNGILAQTEDGHDTPVTDADVLLWVNACVRGGTPDIDAGTGPGQRPFPVSLSCGTGGVDETGCETLNPALDRLFREAEFKERLAALKARYIAEMRNGCLRGLPQREIFTATYTLDEFQYTLYYYDRAGNLIKTVPPEGVQPLTQARADAARTYRNAGFASPDYAYLATGALNPAFVRPDHRLITNYKYNSLEQLTEQTTPDAGKTEFFYDAYGRLVISQNAQQAVDGKYSYTRYDDLGRITETGQTTASGVAQASVQDPAWLANFYTATAAAREQVTLTRYDSPSPSPSTGSGEQGNARNRVAGSYYFEITPNAALTNYVHATHYGYDVHGNVERAVQDFPFLNQFGMRFSVTEYEYETVSGNILKVTYRKGQADQLYHRYSYDRTNRLIVTETSRDGVIWDKDARYYYYAHGPLARTETGTQKVQGTDVAYTVNGWTKAVNATRLTPQNDAGHDGDHAVLSAANTNRGFARDAFGYGLTYFRNDYTSAGTQAMEAADMFDTGTDFGAAIAGEGQYNGNIAAMTTALRGPDGTAQDELGQVYAYDQLYRLQNTRGFLRAPSARFRWSGVPGTTKWNTSYTYDANGNIATLKRQDQAGAAMDDITYDYARSGGRLTDNRLQHATDAVASSSNPDDYEVGLPLTGNNFNYDRNGNLVYDKSEGIDKIVWNVYGKVTKVDRTAGHAKPDLEFYYDASGRRVMKIVKPNGGSGAKNTWKYVVFSYDAGGQLMAEYETAYKSGTYGLVNTGNYVYGSKRLGKTREKIPLGPMVNYTEIQNCTACATAPVVPGNTAPENIYARTAGNKQYEFANHLGNVLVTVSDRHLQTDDGSYSYLGGTLTQTGTVPDGLLDYYMPQVLTANDYYPGGMPMPGRICSTQTTVVTAVLRDDPFNSGTASYTGTNGATLSNSSGTLLVTKLSSATDSWGARTPAHTLTAGVEYRLSYLLTLGACSAGRETRGWRVVDAAGNDIAGNIVLGTGPFNVNGTFTVPATGTYYIEFYRNTSSTGTCSFTIDNVLLISNTYLTVKVCGTPAEQYAWGHNGQYKDDEIYGPGNTYTAEYWEYDSRLIRRWNTDPITDIWQSPYACFNNNPIFFSDPLGLKAHTKTKSKGKETEKNKKQGNKENKQEDAEDAPDFTYQYSSNTGSTFEPKYNESKSEPVKTEKGEKQSRAHTLDTKMPSFYFIFQDITPEIYKFTQEALTKRPDYSVLTYNGGGDIATQNRRQATRGCDCNTSVTKRSRDEFPYAITKQGGKGAFVFCAPVSEQQAQAVQLAALARSMTSGDHFFVVLIPSVSKIPIPQPILSPINERDVKPVPPPVIPPIIYIPIQIYARTHPAILLINVFKPIFTPDGLIMENNNNSIQ